MITNGDGEGRIFLSHPHTNNGFSFLLTTKYHIFYWKNMKKAFSNAEFAEMRHSDLILTLQWRHGPMCDHRAADMRLFVFYLSHGLVQVCEKTRIHHWCSVVT